MTIKNMQTDKKFNKVRKNNPKKVEEDMISVIVVDDQFDFGDPNGALYVPGGENINQPILNYIKNNPQNPISL